MDLRTLGEAIARGTQAPFQRRAERVQGLIGHLFGPGGPQIPGVTPGRAPPRRPLRSLGRDRRAILKHGLDALEALLTGRLDHFGASLAEQVWVLWPDGTLLLHERQPLLAALRARFREPVRVVPSDGRSYDFAELRAGVAAGLAEAWDARFQGHRGAILSARLDGRLELNRISLLLEPEEDAWRLCSLPLVGLDEAWVAGRSSQGVEDEGLRIADRALRHHGLGHQVQLRSLRNQCLRQIWVDDALIETEAWPAMAAQQCQLATAADLVFQGVRAEPGERLSDRLGSAQARAVEQQAKAAWQRPLDFFRPRLAIGTIARWDPEQRTVVEPREVPLLLARELDVDVRNIETERWRLAGLWPSAARPLF